MTSKDLPDRPNLKQYKKQAKDLLRGCRDADPEALHRMGQWHPRIRNLRDRERGLESITLADAQWVIAREHGLPSWPKFAKRILELGLENRANPIHNGALFTNQLEIETEEIFACAFTLNGTRTLIGAQGNPVRLFDVKTGQCLRAFEGHTGPVWALTWSGDERRFLSGAFDRTMRLWNTETGHCIRVFEGEHARSIAWSPDQKQALSASKVCVRLWDIETGECLRAFRGHTNGVYCLVWPANQRRFLSASTDGTVRLWDVDTGRCLQVLKHDGVGYVAWSADHLGVLSAGVDIRLWDPETGACRQVLQGHSDTVRSIEWSTVQGRALSCSHDGTVRLWDTTAGCSLRIFEGHKAGVVNAKLSADERHAFSCDWNGGVRAWDVREARSQR